MYKVLLADDEQLDLEGMKRFIPWSELGLEVVGAVNNGFMACEVLERVTIDILVTDVNMPNMSGLELARMAIKKKENVKIVFVSGYQDFNYVKEALSLRAFNYVLKPMADEELISSLQGITEELKREGNPRGGERRKNEGKTHVQAQSHQEGRNSRLIRDILETMRMRMRENITLKDIAEQFAFSPNYLGHLFKEEMGLNFSEMLINMRMERARELLKNPTAKIYEVADQVGYRYLPYFSRQFKEMYGMTPMEYRKWE